MAGDFTSVLPHSASRWAVPGKLRRGSAEAIAKLVKGETVDSAEIYFRCVPTFEVSDPALAWLTESVFIGTGARFADRVEIAFYRVE